MRLGYLVSRYPAISHSFILREVRRMRAMGWEIEVASINEPDRPEGELTAEEREEAARTYYVKRAGWRGALAAAGSEMRRAPGRCWRGLRDAWGLRREKGIFYLAEAVMVSKWMERRGLEHLHVHFATPAATVGMLASVIGGRPWSLTVHGPDEFDEVTAHRLREKVVAADFVICISSFARSQLMRISPVWSWERLEVSRLGVDPAIFAPRMTSGRRSGPVEILSVGRMTAAKGQRILLAAVARLVGEGREIRLRLVGDGPERAALEREATRCGLDGYVTFAGAIDQERIGEYYARADIFALASLAEGIPVVLMEAMAMEIPCVSTWIAGIPELIRSGEDGLLVAPGDESDLAAALGRLIDDAGMRVRIGRAARRRIEQQYCLEESVDRLAAIFRRRIGLSGRRNERS